MQGDTTQLGQSPLSKSLDQLKLALPTLPSAPVADTSSSAAAAAASATAANAVMADAQALKIDFSNQSAGSSSLSPAAALTNQMQMQMPPPLPMPTLAQAQAQAQAQQMEQPTIQQVTIPSVPNLHRQTSLAVMHPNQVQTMMPPPVLNPLSNEAKKALAPVRHDASVGEKKKHQKIQKDISERVTASIFQDDLVQIFLGYTSKTWCACLNDLTELLKSTIKTKTKNGKPISEGAYLEEYKKRYLNTLTNIIKLWSKDDWDREVKNLRKMHPKINDMYDLATGLYVLKNRELADSIGLPNIYSSTDRNGRITFDVATLAEFMKYFYTELIEQLLNKVPFKMFHTFDAVEQNTLLQQAFRFAIHRSTENQHASKKHKHKKSSGPVSETTSKFLNNNHNAPMYTPQQSMYGHLQSPSQQQQQQYYGYPPQQQQQQYYPLAQQHTSGGNLDLLHQQQQQQQQQNMYQGQGMHGQYPQNQYFGPMHQPYNQQQPSLFVPQVPATAAIYPTARDFQTSSSDYSREHGKKKKKKSHRSSSRRSDSDSDSDSDGKQIDIRDKKHRKH